MLSKLFTLVTLLVTFSQVTLALTFHLQSWAASSSNWSNSVLVPIKVIHHPPVMPTNHQSVTDHVKWKTCSRRGTSKGHRVIAPTAAHMKSDCCSRCAKQTHPSVWPCFREIRGEERYFCVFSDLHCSRGWVTAQAAISSITSLKAFVWVISLFCLLRDVIWLPFMTSYCSVAGRGKLWHPRWWIDENVLFKANIIAQKS